MGCLTFCSIVAGIDQVGQKHIFFEMDFTSEMRSWVFRSFTKAEVIGWVPTIPQKKRRRLYILDLCFANIRFCRRALIRWDGRRHPKTTWTQIKSGFFNMHLDSKRESRLVSQFLFIIYFSIF